MFSCQRLLEFGLFWESICVLYQSIIHYETNLAMHYYKMLIIFTFDYAGLF
jgi:hypothetical protein